MWQAGFSYPIHILEQKDIALYESLAGNMRSIAFVFQTTGVNRPLRQHEEHPNENQNHITYRDEVNKLANATKDIIEGLIHQEQGGLVLAQNLQEKSQALQ